MNLLKSKVFTLLKDPSYRDDDEVFLNIILWLGFLLASLIHVFFLFLFLSFDVPLFVFMNIGSLTIYALVFVLHRARAYTAAGLIFTLEVCLYTLLSVLASGTATSVYNFYFLTLLIQAMIPYAKPLFRTVVGVFIGLLLTFCLVAGESLAPFAPFTPELTSLCHIINVETTFVGQIAVIGLAEYIRHLITEYHRVEMKKYQKQAQTDSLTGLYNRHYANMLFGRLMPDADYVIALLDIDDFKSINDRYGHTKGDEVLVRISSILNKSLRKTDAIIRWGGEEFLVLLQNIDLATAKIVLEKTRASIAEQTYTHNESTFHATVSIGAYPLDNADVHQSISLCDRKLYESKHSGKNRVTV